MNAVKPVSSKSATTRHSMTFGKHNFPSTIRIVLRDNMQSIIGFFGIAQNLIVTRDSFAFFKLSTNLPSLRSPPDTLVKSNYLSILITLIKCRNGRNIDCRLGY